MKFLATLFLSAQILALSISSAHAQAPSDITRGAERAGFRSSGRVQNLQNGTIHFGNVVVNGREFPAALIDYYGTEYVSNSFFVMMQTGTQTRDWDTAKKTCESLGGDWGLPSFERRFQMAQAKPLMISGGTITDPRRIINDIYVFWSMPPVMESIRQKFDGKHNAVILSMPQNETRLQPLAYSFWRMGDPGNVGKNWKEGHPAFNIDTGDGGYTIFDFYLNMSVDGLAQDIGYLANEVKTNRLKRAKAADTLSAYFRSRNDSNLSSEGRRIVNFIGDYLNTNPKMKKELEAAYRAGDQALLTYVTTRMDRWYMIYSLADWRWTALFAESLEQLGPILNRIQSASVPLPVLYCAMEVGKDGSSVGPSIGRKIVDGIGSIIPTINLPKPSAASQRNPEHTGYAGGGG